MSRRRNKLVTFVRPPTLSDPFSASDPEWPNAFEDEPVSYVEVHPMRGDELFQAQQTHQTVTHKVTTDYREGITSKLRIQWGTRLLEIVGIINPREANRSLELMCVEMV